MEKRFLIVFILLLLYAVFLAPGSSNADDPLFSQLITGQFEEVDSLVVAVFSMLGIYPVLFALLLLPQDTRRLPAWPFVILSFGLGAFIILPYLALRGRQKRDTPRGPSFVQRSAVHPLLYVLVLLISIAVYLVAAAGSFSGYQEAFMNSHLVSVMTIDFIVVIWLTYDILRKDWQMRYAWLAFLPAVGPLVLLLWQKKLKQSA